MAMHSYQPCHRCGMLSRSAVTDFHKECKACQFRRHDMDGRVMPNPLELEEMQDDILPWPQKLSRRKRMEIDERR